MCISFMCVFIPVTDTSCEAIVVVSLPNTRLSSSPHSYRKRKRDGSAWWIRTSFTVFLSKGEHNVHSVSLYDLVVMEQNVCVLKWLTERSRRCCDWDEAAGSYRRNGDQIRSVRSSCAQTEKYMRSFLIHAVPCWWALGNHLCLLGLPENIWNEYLMMCLCLAHYKSSKQQLVTQNNTRHSIIINVSRDNKPCSFRLTWCSYLCCHFIYLRHTLESKC